jgi:transketolase
MRPSFFEALGKLYQKKRDIFVLTADLGYRLFDNFKTKCEDRFYNVGVAEANMIGIASGLALSGKNVYCYSIIPFLIMRAFEQIRIDIAYHNLNVKLVGVGGGFTYGLEGFTHFGLEDFALMRTLPNVAVVVPADPFEAKCLAKISYEYEGPMYIRLGKTGETAIHKRTPDFQIGKSIVLTQGKDIALFAIGSMVSVSKEVAVLLKKRGINPTLINMHTIKPLDKATINQIASTHNAIFSLEEHYIDGGLGTAIAEVLSESKYCGLFKRFGIDRLNKHIGNCDYLRRKYGLSPDEISKNILKEMKS